MSVLGKDLFDFQRSHTNTKVEFGASGYWVEMVPEMQPYGTVLTEILNLDVTPFQKLLDRLNTAVHEKNYDDAPRAYTIPLEAWCCGHREEVTMSIDHSSPYNSLAGKRTYTVEEIAKILGIGRTAAYSLVHSGVFKAVRIGSSIRVSKVSFDDWLDKQNM